MIRSCSVLVFALVSFAVAAENAKTVLIVDRSPSDSPISISGQVMVVESGGIDATTTVTYHEHLVATNTSKKTIVGLVTELSVSGSIGTLVRQVNMFDSYFSDEEIISGGQFTHTEHGNAGLMEVPALIVTPLPPQSEARVLFVQFADGSTYGDAHSPSALEFLLHRSRILETLHSLEAAAHQGEAGFLAALSVSLDDYEAEGTIDHEIRQVQKDSGTQAAVANVNAMLKRAYDHAHSMGQ